MTPLRAATSPAWGAASPGAGAARCWNRWARPSSRPGLWPQWASAARSRTVWRRHLAEVIGFRGSNVLSMPLETPMAFASATRGGLGHHARN